MALLSHKLLKYYRFVFLGENRIYFCTGRFLEEALQYLPNIATRRPASLNKSDCRWRFLLQAGNLARQLRIDVVMKMCPVATRNFG
jgi:hypothetical protein